MPRAYQQAARMVEVRVKGGEPVMCLIERTNDRRDMGPQWELFAPDGYRFDDELHTMLCLDMGDVRERAAGAVLTACPADCDCRDEVRS